MSHSAKGGEEGASERHSACMREAAACSHIRKYIRGIVAAAGIGRAQEEGGEGASGNGSICIVLSHFPRAGIMPFLSPFATNYTIQKRKDVCVGLLVCEKRRGRTPKNFFLSVEKSSKVIIAASLNCRLAGRSLQAPFFFPLLIFLLPPSGRYCRS